MNGSACRRVQALRESEIERMLRVCDAHAESPARRRTALRDAALLALGFSCALRRSEICGLTVVDVAISDPTDGAEEMKMFVTIRRSKTDRHGRGQRIAPCRRAGGSGRLRGCALGWRSPASSGASCSRRCAAAASSRAGRCITATFRVSSRRRPRPSGWTRATCRAIRCGRIRNERRGAPGASGQDHGDHPAPQSGDRDDVHPRRGCVHRPRGQRLSIRRSPLRRPTIGYPAGGSRFDIGGGIRGCEGTLTLALSQRERG